MAVIDVLVPEMVRPVLATGGATVFAFTLECSPDVLRPMAACLNEDEQRRAGSLAWQRDRRRFIVARGQLRHLLASRIGVAPSEVEFDYGPYGKPSLARRLALPGPRFSVARSDELAVIALSDAGEVGVDVEVIRPVPEAEDIAKLCFASPDLDAWRRLPAERRTEGFLRRWTRLEATAKALGCGLGRRLPPEAGRWKVRDFDPLPGSVGTLVFQN